MTTTIEFYKYHVNSDDNAQKIHDCIKPLIGKTHIYSNGDLPRDLYNLSELSHGYIGGVLRKVRPDNTIEYGQVGKDGKPYHQLIALNEFYPPIDSRAKPFEVIGVVLEHKRVLV